MKYYAFSIFQDCKDRNRRYVCLCLSSSSVCLYSKLEYINPNASRINIQNTCTYICKRNTIVNGDKNGAHVTATTKNRRKKNKKAPPLHYRSVEAYWTCMIHVSKRQLQCRNICIPRCHEQSIYCTLHY